MENERGVIEMHYVIIGGDAAGMSAAMQIYKFNQEAKITIFEAGEVYSYGQCGIPYVIGQTIPDVEDLIVRDVTTYREKYKMNATTYIQAEQVLPEEKKVIGKNLKTGEVSEVTYDKLLIATGAEPFMPDWPGNDLEGVFPVKTVPDTVAIQNYISSQQVKKAVIIGGGYIALEMAENLKLIDIDVTMLIRSEEIGKMFDQDMQAMILEEAQKVGVKVKFHEDVKEIVGKKAVKSIKTNQATYDTDMVLVATGIKPSTAFLKSTNINLNEKGAIQVNKYLETNIEDIYAAGDCALQYHRVKSDDDYVPLGTHANKQGRIAGMNMVGKKRAYSGMVGTSILRFFDLTLAKTGLSDKEAAAMGVTFDTVLVTGIDIAGNYPGHEKMQIKATYEKDTLRLLGAQIIGGNGVDKRIDVLATALFNHMDALQIEDLDLAYSPPYNGVWDPIHRMARKIVSQSAK